LLGTGKHFAWTADCRHTSRYSNGGHRGVIAENKGKGKLGPWEYPKLKRSHSKGTDLIVVLRSGEIQIGFRRGKLVNWGAWGGGFGGGKKPHIRVKRRQEKWSVVFSPLVSLSD